MSNDQGPPVLINTFASTWTKDQKVAVASLCVRALDHLAYQNALVSIIRLTRSTNPNDKLAPDPVSLLLPASPKAPDIRTEVIVDILAVSLGLHRVRDLPQTPSTISRFTDSFLGTSSPQPYTIAYDARSRALLFCVANLIGLASHELLMVEKSIGQQLYFQLQERRDAGQEDSGPTEDSATIMDQHASRAMDDQERKKRKWRWFATGMGVAGGAAIIGLTGGLAAPVVAPLVAGLTGASFFATTGGIALMTGVFGLTGWKMHRRTRGIKDFSFTQIIKDPTLPPIPSLHLTICISGYLLTSKDEVMTPWRSTFNRTLDNRDVYCVEFEPEVLLALGTAFDTFIASEALKYTGAQLVGRTVLAAFFSALALPGALMKAADLIDNPWQLGVDRAVKAGLVLADVLQEHVQGRRPATLIGYSLGALVIWSALKELARLGKAGLVDTAILIGAPVSAANLEQWDAVASVVARRIVNCYSEDDWVLGELRVHWVSA
ncbi:hypothetical protein BC937DRAFT_92262 [Endogone sp. FLAS-F59071]|nr:hypothetical protein BC937DRAFT_92262 [Endogone sp. FLAS-F59071]|eukprot:RUS15585.1 hypothetical protein BC937DRAFT_92262 [Endogone sp. FLAS-F59071]